MTVVGGAWLQCVVKLYSSHDEGVLLMLSRKADLAIVNCHFWPQGLVVGESILRFVEKASLHDRVVVITQSNLDLEKVLKKSDRGGSAIIRSCRSLTDSSSHFFMRII